MTLRLTQEEFDAIRSGVQSEIKAPKIKRVDSKCKAQLDLLFLSLKADVAREHIFHESRKWRFDYALPALKVAIEYEGLPLQTDKSRHTTIRGFAGDCEKYSEAAILGWCVIRVNALSIESGLAHDLIRRAIDSRMVNHPQATTARRMMPTIYEYMNICQHDYQNVGTTEEYSFKCQKCGAYESTYFNRQEDLEGADGMWNILNVIDEKGDLPSLWDYVYGRWPAKNRHISLFALYFFNPQNLRKNIEKWLRGD